MTQPKVLVSAVSDSESNQVYSVTNEVFYQYQVQYLGRAGVWRAFDGWRTQVKQIDKLLSDPFLYGKKTRVVRRLVSEAEEVEWPLT